MERRERWQVPREAPFELAKHRAPERLQDDLQPHDRRPEVAGVEVVKPSHRSENLNWEFWLRDPDGYMVVLTSPLRDVTRSYDAREAV